MTMYWLMFTWPLIAVLFPNRMTQSGQRLSWVLVGLAFSIVMGLRYEVGGDWFNYLPYFEDASVMSFTEAISQGDPGYFALNWVSSKVGGGVFLVNLFCATAMMVGTIVFSRRQPNPWIALLTAVPYMLVVVGMGYTRQAVALGFALVGLTALGEGKVRAFVIWVAIGALFHKSAVLLLPIAALAASRHRIITAALVLGATALMYYLLLQDSTETLWNNYIDADLQSEGGAIRVAMNAVPAVLLLLYRKRLAPELQQRKLWLWIAVFALACIPIVGIASTAVDRVALYLIPLQLFVFSRLPRLAGSVGARTPIILGIAVYYASVEFVWLNYATNAYNWLPYKFMPL